MTQGDIHEFVARRNVDVPSTRSPNGEPQTALMRIAVNPDVEIVFDKVKSSRKYSGC